MEIVALVVVAVAAGIWKLFFTPPTAKNKPVESFPDLLRSLYISMTNGSVLSVSHRESDIDFSYVRESGEEENVRIELRIPRAEWSTNMANNISESFRSKDFPYFEETQSSEYIGRVEIIVPSIWDNNCGASGAYAARVLMTAIGLPFSSRFDVKAEGESSERIYKALDHT